MGNVSSKKIVSSLSWSFAEKILTDVINLLITIVLARLLLPEDYGLVALVQIFINISLIFVNTGLSSALIQSKDPDEEQISTVFYINLVLGIIIYAILFFAAPAIAKFRKNDLLCPLFRVLAIKIPISSVYSMQHAYVKKRLQFKKYFFSSLAGTLVSGVVGIIMAYKGYGVWSLVVATLIDQIMDSITLFFTTKWLPNFRIAFDKSKNIIDYGIKILTREFIARFASQIRPLIIGIKYSSEDLAFSNKGTKYPELISELTESTMTRVMFPVLSNVQDDKEKFREIVKSTFTISFFVLAPMMAGLFIIAPKFISLLLTDKWLPCVPYMRLICISYLVSIMYASDLRAIEASGKGTYLVKIQTLTTTINMIILFFSVILFDEPIMIIACSLISTVIETLIVIYYSNNIIKYNLIEHIVDIVPTIIITILMSIIVFFVGFIRIEKIYLLISQVIVGIVSYIILSVGFKLKPAMFIIDFIKNKSK